MRRTFGFFLLAGLFFGSAAGLRAEDQPKHRLIATESESHFLDRLMSAESNGRQDARNPASSAFGPFQFIKSTFLEVIRRNMPEVAAGKSEDEILALRADMAVARDAALAYTRENGATLAGHGFEVAPAHLRMAFLVGPAASLRILAAKAEEPLRGLVSQAARDANPFLDGMTAGEFIARCGREADGTIALASSRAENSGRGGAKIAVRCNLKLASCRKWLALAQKRLTAKGLDRG